MSKGMNLIALQCEINRRGITFYQVEGNPLIQYRSKGYVTVAVKEAIHRHNSALADALLQVNTIPAIPDEIDALLIVLAERRITLSIVNGGLHCSCTREAMTPDIYKRIERNQCAIMQRLNQIGKVSGT